MPYYPTTSKKDKYEILCQLPLSSELFAQAIHPNEPVVAVGMSSGHVQSFRLPADEEDEADDSDDEGNTSVHSNAVGTIETQWRTRRHKGSCRSLGYSLDGETLYSAGTDGLLKAFNSATGVVSSKILIPQQNGKDDYPTLLRALTPQTLLLATDSSALHLYDLREQNTFSSNKPAQTHRPHDDYISSISPLPPTAESTSGYSKQWVTTGGTTLAVTDLRRGVMVKSENQEEELLSSVVVGGFPARGGSARSLGQKVVVGSGNGVLTLWERGVWDDQDERVIVMPGGKSGGDSLDVLAVVPGGRREVAVGCGDGKVRLVNLTGRGVQETLLHDVLEGVLGVGFDALGRLISGGGNMVKVWAEKDQSAQGSDSEDEDDSDDEDASGKRKKADASSDEDSSSEEEKPVQKKKKGKGKDKGIGNGILGFDI